MKILINNRKFDIINQHASIIIDIMVCKYVSIYVYMIYLLTHPYLIFIPCISTVLKFLQNLFFHCKQFHNRFTTLRT